MEKPNILFLMCDQLTADAISALGNRIVQTPNIDRLVRRGVHFTKAYSSCPVCCPARYNIRTGREPYHTGIFQNGGPIRLEGQQEQMEDRCGKYLARTMSGLGYRTFGIGKFHTVPWNEDLGYETQLYSEEMYDTEEQRNNDAYASFINDNYPQFKFIEQLHGERTDMYYMPQMSPLPAHLTVESWAADRAVEQLSIDDRRPYFGMVSFIGPHPPLAPPIPFNRMYNPDLMPNPIRGHIEIDHMDEHLPWMNYLIWAEEINDPHARILKARYYGEISYIDQCIGKILNEVEARPDADNTLICFFSDHGDLLGDHHSWQKESFFEASCRIPFLVSWPSRLPSGMRNDDLVCLTDLFGIATSAAGDIQVRDGIDLIGSIEGRVKSRNYLFGFHGLPGSPRFKIMVREKDWKYIFMANGGHEQLFHVTEDPDEIVQQIDHNRTIAQHLREIAVQQMDLHQSLKKGLDGKKLREFPFQARELIRIQQFDASRGISGYNIN